MVADREGGHGADAASSADIPVNASDGLSYAMSSGSIAALMQQNCIMELCEFLRHGCLGIVQAQCPAVGHAHLSGSRGVALG